jgi:ribosome-associated protein
MPQRPAPGRQAARDADSAVDEDGRWSRSALKRHSQSLQALGEQLTTLSESQLAQIDLPEPLREALAEWRRTRSHEGRRRHLQYIGKLMHQADEAALREAIAATQVPSAQATLQLHETERWRQALVDEDGALTKWLAQHPDSDAQQLRSLIRNARAQRQAEAAGTVPPGTAPRQGRAWRELFQFLRPFVART